MKMKKILASLGVLATASVAMVGCSNLEMNQAQVDKVLTEAETFLETQNDLDYETLVSNLNNYLTSSNQNLTQEQIEEIVRGYIQDKEANAITYIYSDNECKELIENIGNKFNQNYNQNNMTYTENMIIKDNFGNILSDETAVVKQLYDAESKTFKILKQQSTGTKIIGAYKVIKENTENYEITTYFIGKGVYNKRIISKVGFNWNDFYQKEVLEWNIGEESTTIPSGTDTYYSVKELYNIEYVRLQTQPTRLGMFNRFYTITENAVNLPKGDLSVSIDSQNFNIWWAGEASEEVINDMQFQVANTYDKINEKHFQYMKTGVYEVTSVIEFNNTEIEFDTSTYISIEQDQSNNN